MTDNPLLSVPDGETTGEASGGINSLILNNEEQSDDMQHSISMGDVNLEGIHRGDRAPPVSPTNDETIDPKIENDHSLSMADVSLGYVNVGGKTSAAKSPKKLRLPSVNQIPHILTPSTLQVSGMIMESHEQNLPESKKLFIESAVTSVDPAIYQQHREKLLWNSLSKILIIGSIVIFTMVMMFISFRAMENQSGYDLPHDYGTNSETRLVTNMLAARYSHKDKLFKRGSAQNQALDWILYDDPMTSRLVSDLRSVGFDYALTGRYVLAVLWFSTSGENWKRSGSWLTGADACDWFGVLCIDGEAHTISLGNNNMIGTIPEEMKYLHVLAELTLNNNFLEGSLPHSLGELYHLDVSSNDIQSSLPAVFWTNAFIMQTMDLSNNNFMGTIPTEIGLVTNASYMNLAGNNLRGSIPAELEKLTKLETFSLESNELTGTIPSNIGALLKMKQLNLGHNEFVGTIPTGLSDLTNLEVLTMQQNSLTGTLPKRFGLDHKDMISLNLNDNALTGRIPYDLHFMQSLQTLDLSYNKFSGSISNEFVFFQDLRFLHLDGNQLTGSIPFMGVFEQLTKIETISLRSNNMDGSIQSNIANLSMLRTLSIGENELTGNIPVEISNMFALESLKLDQTRLSGTISESICALKSRSLKEFVVDCNVVSCSCCTNCST